MGLPTASLVAFLEEEGQTGGDQLPWYELIPASDWALAAVVFLLGWALSKLVSSRVAALVSEHVSKQTVMLLRRGILYFGLLVSLSMALQQLNFSLGIFLGAAGVLTVAIGFASQTSASNIISGLFLLGERPFSVGDVVQIGGTSGEVLSIDLLAIHLRTFDNIFVRIPNETVIKSEVRTLSRFPIRRYDLQLGIAYKEDIERVREILLEVADADPICLEEPVPLIIFQGFGDSSIDLQFSIWSARENYLELRNKISGAVKRRFDEEGIEIPFPHRTLYTGSATEPLPIRLSHGPEQEPEQEPQA
ncbi:MAG: mechanosensitive ion channel family protein [Planctomycetota bacterium]|nr:mechanosensitive ion channel family protein [Planctomycetota bacterium]